MSVFSIKLKTRNGNDVKKKETITVFFRTKYRTGLKTKCEFSFRIMSSQGVYDTLKVYELKDKAQSYEDMMLKVIINLCHMVKKIAKDNNFDPDFILFMTPDITTPKNRSFMFIRDVFFRPENKTPGTALSEEMTKVVIDEIFKENWDQATASNLKLNLAELEILKDFSMEYCLTKIMFIDPGRDPVKYAKSIHILKMLEDRIDRNLQITANSKSKP